MVVIRGEEGEGLEVYHLAIMTPGGYRRITETTTSCHSTLLLL
jgi:hypothetical protein